MCWSVLAFGDAAQDWFAHLNRLAFWERIAEIRAVSELPKSVQKERVPALMRLLDDADHSVRVTAAREIAEIRDVSAEAIPSLIKSFKRENGEEGMEYVEAVSAFGNQVLPVLRRALKDENWLVRARACDGIRKIDPKLPSHGECRRKGL